MGTRSITIFFDEAKAICVMYRQFDGYPTGHGAELAAFLASRSLVNGISGKRDTIANGPHCLAALAVSFFKGNFAGGIYLYPPDERDLGQDYTYEVHCKEGVPTVMIIRDGYTNKQIWAGTAQTFNPKDFEDA